MSNTQKRYDTYANFNSYADTRTNNSGPYKKYKQVGEKEELKPQKQSEQVQTTAKQAIRNPSHFTIDSNQNGRELDQNNLSLQRTHAPPQSHPNPIYTPLSKVSQPERNAGSLTQQNFGKEASVLASQTQQPRTSLDNVENFEGPSIVKPIQGKDLYALLTNPMYKLSKTGKPSKLIVKLYTDWCKPCGLLAPKMEVLAKDSKYNDFLFLAVNPEQMGSELGRLPPFDKVGAVPIIYSFYGQVHKDTVYGADIKEVQEMCDNLAKL